MFDIGWGELVVIGVVALVAIGPKELPGVLRSLGQWMGKIRRMSAEFQGQFQEALREAEMADLKKQAEDIQSSVSSLTNFDPLAEAQKSIEAPAEPPSEASAPETAPATAEAASPPPIDVPLPEPLAPVTAADFTPPTTTPEPPPAKAAGSGA